MGEVKNKYYTPEIKEFYVGFEYEKYYQNKWNKEILEVSDWVYPDLGELGFLEQDLNENIIRVKYLDKEDIIELGFEKSNKDQWIGWNDYYSGDVSGECGYFLYVTIHFPRLYNKSHIVEDNFFKIIVHRHYVSNEDKTTNIDNSLEQGESEIVYKGIIKNKSELKKLMKQLGI